MQAAGGDAFKMRMSKKRYQPKNRQTMVAPQREQTNNALLEANQI